MNYTLYFIFSLSGAIAAIVSIFRWKKLQPVYHPFIFLLWLGILNELLSHLMVEYRGSNTINYNIFALVEYFLVVWLFHRWGMFKENSTPIILMAGGLLVWILENLVIWNLDRFCSYFIISSSYVIVLLSIQRINQLVLKSTGLLLRNASFLLSFCFLFYFAFVTLVEAFWLYGFGSSKVFTNSIFYVIVYVNLITNLAYVIVVLWIPSKPNFILPS